MSWLFFLANPWFVVPWYAVGALGAGFLVYDLRNHNTVLKPAMKWGWPIIVFFFSVIGLALYFATARAPGVGRLRRGEEKQRAHDAYERAMWRRVNGAAIHCVAGDGFGIMTAMVIARASGMSFWQEFWFEYAVGFAIGWFIFQRKSMEMMTDHLPTQLAMAFRGEFFSMLTVMGGMGAVMTYVTPQVVTAQPKPLTAAFWGFGMLGLLVGYVMTIPMNWMMVTLGWKHGMGSSEGATRVEAMPARAATVAAMVVLGCAALVLPAWLTLLRQRAPLAGEQAALVPAPQGGVGPALAQGFQASAREALDALDRGDMTGAALATDSAHRAAEVGTYSAPGAFYAAMEQVRAARLALQQAQRSEAARHLASALKVVRAPASASPAVLELPEYEGATVVDEKGAVIGEVTRVSGDDVDVALGGWRNAWGFVDFGAQHHVQVQRAQLAYGPPHAVGYTLVALPTVGAAVSNTTARRSD